MRWACAVGLVACAPADVPLWTWDEAFPEATTCGVRVARSRLDVPDGASFAEGAWEDADLQQVVAVDAERRLLGAILTRASVDLPGGVTQVLDVAWGDDARTLRYRERRLAENGTFIAEVVDPGDQVEALDAAGRRLDVRWTAAGVTWRQERSYDADGVLVGVQESASRAGVSVASASCGYTWDPARRERAGGCVREIGDETQEELITWTYDDALRLIVTDGERVIRPADGGRSTEAMYVAVRYADDAPVATVTADPVTSELRFTDDATRQAWFDPYEDGVSDWNQPELQVDTEVTPAGRVVGEVRWQWGACPAEPAIPEDLMP